MLPVGTENAIGLLPMMGSTPPTGWTTGTTSSLNTMPMTSRFAMRSAYKPRMKQVMAVSDPDDRAPGVFRLGGCDIGRQKRSQRTRARVSVDQRKAGLFPDDDRSCGRVGLALPVVLQVAVDQVIEALHTHTSQIGFKVHVRHHGRSLPVEPHGFQGDVACRSAGHRSEPLRFRGQA